MTGLDAARTGNLLRRTYLLTAMLAVAGALLMQADRYAAMTLLVGAVLGIGFVAITASLVERAEPGAASRRRKVRTAILYALKLLIAGAVFWGASRLSVTAMIGVAAGYTLPLVVMMVLALGREVGKGPSSGDDKDAQN